MEAKKSDSLLLFGETKEKVKEKKMNTSASNHAHESIQASNNSSLSSIGSDIDAAGWKLIQQELRKGGHWSTMSARIAIANSSKKNADSGFDEKDREKAINEKVATAIEESPLSPEKVKSGATRRNSRGSLDLLNISSHVSRGSLDLLNITSHVNRRWSSNTASPLDEEANADVLGSRLWKNSKFPAFSDASTNIYDQIQSDGSVTNSTKPGINTAEKGESLGESFSSLGALRAQLVKCSSVRGDLRPEDEETIAGRRPQLRGPGAQPAMTRSLRNVLRMEMNVDNIPAAQPKRKALMRRRSSTDIRTDSSSSSLMLEKSDTCCLANSSFEDPPSHYKGGVLLETWGHRED